MSLDIDLKDEVIHSESPEINNDFSVDKGDLGGALSMLCGIIERRTNIPALSHVKIDIVDGKMSLSATDMDILMTVSNIEIKSGGPFKNSFALPAQMFYEIVRKIDSEDNLNISFESHNCRAIIKSNNSKFNISSLPSEDFPQFNIDQSFNKNFQVPLHALYNMLFKVSFSMSSDRTRYYLNGVFLQYDDKAIHAVSTDGHRLSCLHLEEVVEPVITESSVNTSESSANGMIVPRKSINEMIKILSTYMKLPESEDKKVQVAISENQISFCIDNAYFVSKLVDGQFPNYKSVIPKYDDSRVVVILDKDRFNAAISRVVTVSSFEKTKAVKLCIKDNFISIYAACPKSSNTASEKYEITTEKIIKTGEVEIGLNSRYIQDIISVLDCTEIKVCLVDSDKPVMVLDSNSNSHTNSELFIVMPMRI